MKPILTTISRSEKDQLARSVLTDWGMRMEEDNAHQILPGPLNRFIPDIANHAGNHELEGPTVTPVVYHGDGE